MTPTEALATALGRHTSSAFVPPQEPDGHWPRTATAILAALPEGWKVIDTAALLTELSENPLPGARYAYTVVKRFAETGR